MKLKPSKWNFFLYVAHRLFRPFNLRHGYISSRTKDSSNFRLGSSNKCHSSMTHFGFSELFQEIHSLFSLIVSPITALTKMNASFVWMAACQTALDTIKHVITNSPVLIYPGPSKEYHLFTDASNYTWPGVLTQQRSNSETNGNVESTYHPIMVQSGTFSTSQLKWLVIVKECYVIIVILQNGILSMRCRSHPKVRHMLYLKNWLGTKQRMH